MQHCSLARQLTLLGIILAAAGCRTSGSLNELQDAQVAASGAKKIECDFHYRSSPGTSFSATEKKSCTLNGNGAAPVPAEFSLGGLDFRFGCVSGFFVAADVNSEQIHQVAHQDIPPQVSNSNAYGFTGLNFINAPGGDEVQYWCWKSGSKAKCEFYYRKLPAGTNQMSRKYSCNLNSGPGAVAADEISLGDIDLSIACNAGVVVGAQVNGEILHQVNHQNIDKGTHGVTGLNYVYSPAGEEVQYWCRAGQ